MSINHALSRTPNAFLPRWVRGRSRRFSKALVAIVTVIALAVLAAVLSLTSHAATPLTYGTLDSQPADAATEHAAGVTNAMFELNWASFEPSRGTVSASYLVTMKYYLASFKSAGQRITLGLGLQNPPSWVFSLADSTYVDQTGAHSTEANFVFSKAVRTAAAQYLALVNTDLGLTNFAYIRLTSGGDGEMLYPGSGTYFAFDSAALTGTGLATGMSRNPDPTWKPGTSGMSQSQIARWVTWYIGGLDNVTNWQMTTLAGLGFTGTYETVTPGSGTRPDELTQTEKANLSNDGTTGVGAVWNLYYAGLTNKANVMAYVSSVADQSGGNDSCQPTDTALALTSTTMDAWSSTRWIRAIANANGLSAGGENPGLGLPASLDTFYTNLTSSGMMVAALRQARSCNFTVFYWAHDIHLWDGTIPFTTYATMIKP
jgi:hypothetical protein